jgi:DNA-binding response OmpR family regulator
MPTAGWWEALCAVPVIMMTGDTSLGHIKLQYVDNLTVVQKPFDPNALVALVHNEWTFVM